MTTSACAWAFSKSSVNSKVPVADHRSTMPTMKPTSPSFVIQNAFTAALRGGRTLVPEADQEIRAEPDQLPEDEHLQESGSEHEAQHREDEERLVGVVAAEPSPARSSLRYASE